MKNKLKRYCIYSDSNGTIVNYLRERDIYFTGERVADLNYLSSHPAEPIMDESEFFRKYYRKSKYSIVERLYERALRNR